MPELTEKACNNWHLSWPIIKPEVDVVRNMTDWTIKNNQGNINDLPKLQCHGHFLSSCILLKLRIDGESMQELTIYLAHYQTGS